MLTALALAAALTSTAPAAQPKETMVDNVSAVPVSFLAVHVGGRVRYDKRGYTYQWPGVYFETRFTGRTVTLIFDDDANTFNVIVDDKPYMLLRKPGQTALSLSLPQDGAHSVRLEKRSETQAATGHFVGFIGEAAPPAPVRARQIEFIGDSLTAGYGNTSAFGTCSKDDIFETTDTQQAYAALLARHYDADYRIEAYSGAGLVRNSTGKNPDFHITDLFPRAVLGDPAPDTTPWSPQIVVVNLGGNDFNAPLHAGEKWADPAALISDYRAAYVSFVKALRARYPRAEILLSTTTDKIPFLPATVDAVFANLKAAGVIGIDRINWPAMERTGCDRHPNIHDEATVAQLYIDYIDHHPDLWPKP